MIKNKDDRIELENIIIKNNDRDMRCAPGIEFKDNSCLDLQILIAMAKAYNIENPNKKIKLNDKYFILNPIVYKKYLLKNFQKKINICSDQYCWTKQTFINLMNNSMKERMKLTYRPEGPIARYEWLNTTNINDVMTQYEVQYKDFIYLGTVPIDIAELSNYGNKQFNFKHLNFDELIKKNKIKIGVIFNFDKHDENGSHWVAVYIDLINATVYYYDSYGTVPPDEIRKFIREFEKYIANKNIRCKYKYNTLRYQYKGSECGVYSMWFITSMLNGIQFDTIITTSIPDEEINKLRKKYFINVDF
jgi:hypothetical protein